MPNRRPELLVVAIAALSFDSPSVLHGCLEETSPICATLDREPNDPAGADEPGATALEVASGAVGARRLERLRAAFAATPDGRLAAALAGTLDDQGDTLAGRRLLEAFLADHPHDVDALHGLLEFEWTDDRTARAHELATRWRALAPDDPRALLHDYVTAVTVESDPAVEARLAELARAGGDAVLLGAACNALAFPRAVRCAGALADLVEWRRETPDSRRTLYAILVWNGAEERAFELLQQEIDAELRASGLELVARRFAVTGRCERALGIAGSLRNAELERTLTASYCRAPIPSRAAFLAALESRDARSIQALSWQLPNDPDDTELEERLRDRIASDPGAKELWTVLVGLARGDDARRERRLEEWIAARPGDVEPWNQLAALQLGRGATADAAASLRSALALSAPEQRLGLVRRWFGEASSTGAREIADLLAEELARGGEAAAPLAELVAAERARAQGRLDEALALARGAKRGDDAWRAENLETELLAELGADDELAALLARGAGDADGGETAWWIAAMAADHGRLDLAREQYLRALAADPGDPQLHLSLGELELRAGRSDTGIDALRTAVELRPEESYSRLVLAEALRDEGRWFEAFEALSGHGGAESLLTAELLDLARAAREADERFVAGAALDRALRLAPDALDVRFEQAALAAANGRRNAARHAFTALAAELAASSAGRLPDCVGECEPRALLARARAFLATGELPPARVDVADAVELSERAAVNR